jgi:transposase-like protein
MMYIFCLLDLQMDFLSVRRNSSSSSASQSADEFEEDFRKRKAKVTDRVNDHRTKQTKLNDFQTEITPSLASALIGISLDHSNFEVQNIHYTVCVR